MKSTFISIDMQGSSSREPEMEKISNSITRIKLRKQVENKRGKLTTTALSALSHGCKQGQAIPKVTFHFKQKSKW